MAYNRWGILLCAFVCLSCVVANIERVRKITYVVHHGPPGIYQQQHPVPLSNRNILVSNRQPSGSHVNTQERTRRMSRVTSSSSLVHQPQQLVGDNAGQSVSKVTRHLSYSRSSLQQDTQRNPSLLQQKLQLQGVNVCGGRCCHGWSKSPGSERCTKPNCSPPCQNGGMCLRPHLCVCKPGTKGKVCEESATKDTSSTANGGHGPGFPAPPSRPIPQQAAPQTYPKKVQASPESSPVGQVTLALKQKPHVVLSQQAQQPQMIPPQPLTMNLQHGQTQQFMIKPKYISKSKNAFLGEQSTEGSLPLRGGFDQPGSHFLIICHLPCINGGQCIARDKCHCPPNFTGKLCQIPVHNGNLQKPYSQQQQHTLKATGPHVIHSTHTLPLTVTGQQGIKVNFPPNMVNIHVKHPPEASVQFHQVSRIESSSSTQKKDSQIGQTQISYHGIQKHNLPHNVYPHQQTIPNVYPVSAKTQLGRCFQETTGTQCGKPLPGLSKQDDCCGTVGTSWGFNKCMKCPKKTNYPGYSQLMECPQGYKRINATFCQDINECRLQDVCPNGECLNTIGSYRCTCKLGFVPDPTLSACVADNPLVSEEKGPCYRLVSTGKQCMHPLSVQLTRQLCCCSVGKAWGPHCEKCPVLGTAAFKEICPAGMGYTMPVVRVPPPARTYTVQPPVRTTRTPVITKEEPIEALSVAEKNDPDESAKEDSASNSEQELVTLEKDKHIVDRGQPQLSPGISTINLEPQFPVVVEKSSPPVPVAIAPDVSTSSASQVIAPTQVTEINECVVDPDICVEGQCVNLPEGYTCICFAGYKLNEERTKCVDINECEMAPYRCSHGRCENNMGSFLCICPAGYMANEQGTDCVDVNECLQPNVCENGLCINTAGSFRCEYCADGFRMNRRGQCEDIDECLTPSTCPDDKCVNNPGSYACVPCAEGYRGLNGRCYDINECQEDSTLCANGDCTNLAGSFKCTCRTGFDATSDGKQCIDVDECQLGNLCLNGQCHNTEGSFMCSCNQGFQLAASRDQCEDIDECQHANLCSHGQCRNTEGHFTCICDQGYKVSPAGDQCEDIDECLEEEEACQGGGSCHNTDGAFECTCPLGFQLIHGRRCQDINECENTELCSPNGECLNTPGSFHCICEQGFIPSANGSTCEDVDECANISQCGSQGFCENADGSYRCLCYQGYQDSLDGQGCVDVNECEMLSGVCGEARCENVEGAFLCLCSDDETQEYDPMTGQCRFRDMPDVQYDDEKKECYYNLNDVNFCGNVLTVNVTKQECCCTLGAGWGDNCEIFPCPVLDSDEYAEMCPKGKGYIPSQDTLYDGAGLTYQDADECMLFGKEICKNGFCLNTESSYECYCKQGTYYDAVKFQCLDNDECQDPNSCINGECINTEGSYSCFCTRPMVLDATGKRCIRPLDAVEPTEETDVFQDLCWQDLSEDFVCSRPLVGKQTTYTECCCLYGEAWGMQCALCPMKDSEDYAQLCNIPVRYRQPYGEDALDFSEDYPSPDPYSLQERVGGRKYEELQAEECGILNGCENGRCVRVQEGYTCDCFDGFHLDMMKMTCVDVNECNELNSRMSLCKNAKCINTEGSYKCVCLPGYVPSDKPNYCTALNSDKDQSELE
ncbi:latent-transforming growth factor beta-binding protein 1 isoform X2 [Spea bombifrons]|uniref:latent-transforming growth factor beta-binding protein 1 isoform X2 n=1 Tax=Spea bombifrons TaxID=233779 RepID=UPI00234BCD81|nr:latent-transforming growth factor beta-binding protein 1 isoform X2 [Spea bombifrons]